MKFFSELGSCYRPSISSSRSNQEENKAVQVAAPRPSSRRHAKQINKSGGGVSATLTATRHWKPALHVIREYDVVSGSERKNKIIENKSKPYRVRHNEDSYNSRNNKSDQPIIVPAFSPTPFMY